jgi:hypothetical protein
MLPRAELLKFVVALGREFRRRGMQEHAKKLRLYYLAVKSGLTVGVHEADLHWSEEFTIEWMKTLRLPPFENDFPLHPQGWRCRCPTAASAPAPASVELTFPGGARKRCPACRAVWLELDQLELPAWMRNLRE